MGKTHKDSDKAKAKRLRRIAGQVPRHYGKAGAHEDDKPRREERRKGRKKVDPKDVEDDSDEMEWFFDEENTSDDS